MSVSRVIVGIVLIVVVNTVADRVGSPIGLIAAVGLIATGAFLLLWSNRREGHRTSSQE
jgi:hypothetical protein